MKMNDLVIINNDKPAIKKSVAEVIIETEEAIRKYSEVRDAYRESILEAMLEHGITDIKDEASGINIHLNEARDDIEVFDKKRFRAEDPDGYDKYVNFNGHKNAYITLKIKND